MKHATILQWSPHVLAEIGLFEDAEACAAALVDAPVITLQAGEKLKGSRSGDALVAVTLSGTVQVQSGHAVEKWERGKLLGLKQMLAPAAPPLVIEAAVESVILLLDRRRLLQLADLSPLFSRRIVHDLLDTWDPRGSPVHQLCNAPVAPQDERLSDAIGCVILVRLVNLKALQTCHGDDAAGAATSALVRAVEQSIRPNDLCMFVGPGEYLVGINGDTLAASIVASRLGSRVARLVVFADMRMQLPHLHVVIGIATPGYGDTVGTAASKARSSALQGVWTGTSIRSVPGSR